MDMRQYVNHTIEHTGNRLAVHSGTVQAKSLTPYAFTSERCDHCNMRLNARSY